MLAALLVMAPAAAPAHAESLRGQLVLVTKGSFKDLPDKLVDEVSDHIKARVQSVSVTNVLKSADGRMILEIQFPADRKLAFEKMVAELPTVNFLVPLTVEGWNVKPGTDQATPDRTGDEPRHGEFDIAINVKRDTINSLSFRDVPLRDVLIYLGQQMNLDYICPSEIGRRQITAQLRSVTLNQFFDGLRLSLDVGIKKIGNFYVFSGKAEKPRPGDRKAEAASR